MRLRVTRAFGNERLARAAFIEVSLVCPSIFSFLATEDLSSPLSVSLALCIGMRGGATAAELGGRRCGGAEGVGGAGEGAARAAEEVTRARAHVRFG